MYKQFSIALTFVGLILLSSYVYYSVKKEEAIPIVYFNNKQECVGTESIGSCTNLPNKYMIVYINEDDYYQTGEKK